MVYHFSVDSLTTVFFQTILLCCFNGRCQRLDPCTVVSESVVWGLFGKQVLAIPAVPLTISAGLLFGTLYGTMLVSIWLSPLLPFSIGNYLYGLTSVKLLPYVLGRYFFLIQYLNPKWVVLLLLKLAVWPQNIIMLLKFIILILFVSSFLFGFCFLFLCPSFFLVSLIFSFYSRFLLR